MKYIYILLLITSFNFKIFAQSEIELEISYDDSYVESDWTVFTHPG